MAIVKERVVLRGYEAFYEEAQRQLENVEEEVRKLVEAKTQKLNDIIAMCTEEREVEVPDETEEVAEGEEQVAEDIVE